MYLKYKDMYNLYTKPKKYIYCYLMVLLPVKFTVLLLKTFH